jgi:hypothetical protein
MAISKPRASVGKRAVTAISDGGHAMVQPPPVGAYGDAPSLGTTAQLAWLLQQMGNNRAYTVQSHAGNTWVIMFEGDYAPTVLTFEGEKTNT